MDLIKINRHIPTSQLHQLQLAPFLIGIAQPKNTSLIIKILKEANQEENKNDDHSFLKKVKKVQGEEKVKIILSLHNKTPQEERIKQLVNQHIMQTVVEELPSKAPLTKQQFVEWAKIWPINFIQPQFTKQIQHSSQQVEILIKAAETGHDFCLFDVNGKILMESNGNCCQGSIKHPLMEMLQQWPSSQPYKQGEGKYYHWTNLRLMIGHEICGMCAMALVHSRLERAYLHKLETPSLLEKILLCPQLNHKVIIFNMS